LTKQEKIRIYCPTGEMKYSIVVENVAKMGYERMFDAEWDDLPPDSIERALWKEVALVMVQELWNIYLK